MKQEIERKYGVKNLPNNLKIESIVNIEQGFIYRDFNTHIRIRKIEKTYPEKSTKYIYTLKTKGDIEYNNNYDIGRKYEIENEISNQIVNETIMQMQNNITINEMENQIQTEFNNIVEQTKRNSISASER